VGRAVVIIEGLGLSLAVFGIACGTTVITAQPGREWCVEVQSPFGSAMEPDNLNVQIVEGDLMDPRGCRCFSAADEQILDDGSHAEQMGDPLPAGYEPLRDELVEAARLRCSELAIEDEPPLMYTNCLSAGISLPYPSPDASCTICVETGVWSGSEHEVECPPGLEGATAYVPGTSTEDPTISGTSSLDETGSSDGSGFGLRR
jgi:hypothetical protein